MKKTQKWLFALGIFVSIWTAFPARSEDIGNFENDAFRIQNITFGDASPGTNDFSAVVVNRSSAAKVLMIDFRTESLGFGKCNWQKHFYYPLRGGETMAVEFTYEISGPILSRIILKFEEAERAFDMEAWIEMTAGEREKNPQPKSVIFWTKVIPGPDVAEIIRPLGDEIRRHAVRLNTIGPESLSRLKASLPEGIRKSRNEANPDRKELRELFRIDRERPEDFDYRRESWPQPDAAVVSKLGFAGVVAEPFSIAGEGGNRISAFIATAKGDASVEKPLILLLSGNPPGTKEVFAPEAALFASLGYHAVGIDRRPSARLWDNKEKFLSYLSDPVFDVLRLLDYLSAQTRYKITKIGLYGFSAGASEGKFVAALSDRIDAAVLACGIVSHSWLFKDEAWVPTYSGMMIFPDLGLGNPDIGHLTAAQWEGFLNKLRPEHNQEARTIFQTTFPFFENLDPVRVVPLIAPLPLMIITGAQDEQFKTPGVVEVDRAAQDAYKAGGYLAGSEFLVQPRSGHTVDFKTGYVIAAFFDRWLKTNPNKR